MRTATTNEQEGNFIDILYFAISRSFRGYLQLNFAHSAGEGSNRCDHDVKCMRHGGTLYLKQLPLEYEVVYLNAVTVVGHRSRQLRFCFLAAFFFSTDT